MSDERRIRQQERSGSTTPPAWRKAVLIGIPLLILIGVAAYVVMAQKHKVEHKYDAFAQCLTSKNAKMYGLYWCTHCAEQKEMFGKSFEYVNYIECGIKGEHGEVKACEEAGMKNFPTWQFADGTRVEGALHLYALSQKTGCPLP